MLRRLASVSKLAMSPMGDSPMFPILNCDILSSAISWELTPTSTLTSPAGRDQGVPPHQGIEARLLVGAGGMQGVDDVVRQIAERIDRRRGRNGFKADSGM